MQVSGSKEVPVPISRSCQIKKILQIPGTRLSYVQLLRLKKVFEVLEEQLFPSCSSSHMVRRAWRQIFFLSHRTTSRELCLASYVSRRIFPEPQLAFYLLP